MTTCTPDAGPLSDVLSGERGAAAVRQVVAHPLQYGAMELLEDEGVPVPVDSTGFTLLRSKYKPAHKLSAEYLVSPTADGAEPRHAVLWWTVPAGCPRTTLWLSPADESMPQLQRLTDPQHVAALATSLLDRPVHAPQGARPRVLRYRPGQRHVLVTDLGAVGRVYVKTDRDCSGAVAVRMARVMGDAFARQGVSARTAAPLGWVADDSAALWWAAPGTSLTRLLVNPANGQPSALADVGRALRSLHDTEDGPLPSGGLHTRRRDAPAEASAALGAGAHIAALLPATGRAYAGLLTDVVDRLVRLPQEQPVLSHGDFKGDNILLHHGVPTILDLDRAGLAEPALDLGKFLADLVWWSPDAVRRAPLDAAFRAGYGPCPPLRWERARLWALLFRLKNTARRCPVHAPDWERRVIRGVATASRVLQATGGRP